MGPKPLPQSESFSSTKLVLHLEVKPYFITFLHELLLIKFEEKLTSDCFITLRYYQSAPLDVTLLFTLRQV